MGGASKRQRRVGKGWRKEGRKGRQEGVLKLAKGHSWQAKEFTET